jgi:hypothetical protein
MNCPKCKSNNVSFGIFDHSCNDCSCVWTTWQQAEINNLREHTADKQTIDLATECSRYKQALERIKELSSEPTLFPHAKLCDIRTVAARAIEQKENGK